MDIGIDLGTANTLVYEKKQGIILNEPSMVVKNKKSGQYIAIGADASDMMGKTPDGTQVVRPIRNGVINSYQGTVALLRQLIKKATENNTTFRLRTVICIPCGITEVERRAVMEAAQNAGAKEVFLIEQPLAAAIGCGVPVKEPRGSMVVNIGAGVTEVAVVSLGGIVVSHTIRTAGEAFDNAIMQHAKRKYNVSIGDVTAEQVKCNVGSVYAQKEVAREEVMGRDLVSGLPKTVSITATEIRESLRECAEEIIDAIKVTLEETPPELAADIMESGIVLSGGGALLRGLGRMINMSVDIPVYIAENPMECVAVGAGKAIDFMEEMGQRMKKFL